MGPEVESEKCARRSVRTFRFQRTDTRRTPHRKRPNAERTIDAPARQAPHSSPLTVKCPCEARSRSVASPFQARCSPVASPSLVHSAAVSRFRKRKWLKPVLRACREFDTIRNQIKGGKRAGIMVTTFNYMKIAEALRDEIRAGKLYSDSFPSLTKIMRRFGVSRPSAVRSVEELKRMGAKTREA